MWPRLHVRPVRHRWHRFCTPLTLDNGLRPTLSAVNGRIRIGDLAAQCGVTRDAIRFYEREGLLPRPRRTASRHRVYDQRTVTHLRFIKRSQDLGLSLADVKRLLPLRETTGAAGCRRVTEILEARLGDYEERIARFDTYRQRLGEGLRRCRDGGSAPCRLLTDLADSDTKVTEWSTTKGQRSG